MPGDPLDALHAIGQGLLQHCIDAGDVLFARGHHQLAASIEGHLVGVQEGIEPPPARHAQPRFQRAGRIVESAVDHFGIARGDPLADRRRPLQHHHREAALGQGIGCRQAHRASAHDGCVEV